MVEELVVLSWVANFLVAFWILLWALRPFLWIQESQTVPALVLLLFHVSGSLFFLLLSHSLFFFFKFWQGLPLTYKPLPRRSGFCCKFTTISFQMVHVTLCISLSQNIKGKTSPCLGGISCYGNSMRLTEPVFSQLDFWKLLCENDKEMCLAVAGSRTHPRRKILKEEP